MADEGVGRVAGGDAGNGPVSDGVVAVDRHVNGGDYRRPFLIGVAGGTASGKVCIPVIVMYSSYRTYARCYFT